MRDTSSTMPSKMSAAREPANMDEGLLAAEIQRPQAVQWRFFIRALADEVDSLAGPGERGRHAAWHGAAYVPHDAAAPCRAVGRPADRDERGIGRHRLGPCASAFECRRPGVDDPPPWFAAGRFTWAHRPGPGWRRCWRGFTKAGSRSSRAARPRSWPGGCRAPASITSPCGSPAARLLFKNAELGLTLSGVNPILRHERLDIGARRRQITVLLHRTARLEFCR